MPGNSTVRTGLPKDRLKALSHFPAPVRAPEGMPVAAKSDHDVAGLFLPVPEPSAEHYSPAATSSHKARSERPAVPYDRAGAPPGPAPVRSGLPGTSPLELTGGDSPVAAAVRSIC
jgi:hypothetical protein